MKTPTFKDIEAAHERIRPFVHRTPVMTCSYFDDLVGAKLSFKCENLQKIGAFKLRGATNAIQSLTDAEAAHGVVTHSSGNHAQAVALAAKRRGIAAHIVMPRTAPRVKREATEGYGAQVVPCEPTLEARETTAEALCEQTGATFIHPYNDARVIAGQGTAAKELIEDAGPLDLVIAPVGGGGLLSGTAIATKALLPSATVWGAEPAGADDAKRSMEAGEIIPSTPNTICDALLTSLGTLTFAVINRDVEKIITVDDLQAIAAMRMIWQRMKLIVEVSSAVTLAVALSRAQELRHLRVGVILSGGNVDLDNLPW